ncbi:MAG: response regulator transcription factor [Vicinamibacterales bacterium]
MTDRPSDDRHSLLVVDDDDVFRLRLMRALQERGFDVAGANSCEQALALARENFPEFAVVDMRLPDGSGLELVRELKALDPMTSVVVLTGYGSIATAVESLRLGAVHYLSKPADVEQIVAALGGLPSIEEPADRNVEVPTLARVEWEHIQRVLTDCGGNVSQAARLLGLHRRSLQRKLSKFPVRR